MGINPLLCDSSRSKIGKKLLGMTIYSLEEIIQMENDFCIVISSTIYFLEIKEYINKIYVYTIRMKI